MDKVIYVVKGKGIGKTKKSSFDMALKSAEIENFNLIPLSSVIPPGTELIIETKYPKVVIPGTMQPVVMAEVTSNKQGEKISAGVGWRQSRYGGIFVEVSNKEPLEFTQKELEIGVQEISSHRNWKWFDEGKYLTIEATVSEGFYTSVIVCAIYDFAQVWGLTLPEDYSYTIEKE